MHTICIDVQEIEIFYRRRDFFYGIQGKGIKENWIFFYLLRCIYLTDILNREVFPHRIPASIVLKRRRSYGRKGITFLGRRGIA